MDEVKKDNFKGKTITPQKGGQTRFVRSSVDVCFFGGVLAGGKSNSLNTTILTKNGWIKMRDIKIGDTISTPFNGDTIVKGIYPQGAEDVYFVKTNDGRKGEASLSHLWAVRDKKQLRRLREGRSGDNISILTTEQLIKGMANGEKYYLPIPKAQEFPEKEYLIPPYVLGVMIGDGCLTDNNSDNCFIISNTENDIIDKVALMSDAERVRNHESSCSKYIYTPKSKEYKKYLREVGLATYSYNKFIPQEYLWGSIEQRKQLLFGLMDTDGCVEDYNVFAFSTTSKRLADDFVYLCRSLGYIASVGIDKRSYKYTSGLAYDIIVKTNDIVFSSQKHYDRYHRNIQKQGERRRRKFYDHVTIDSIDYKGKEFTQCIYVEDKDHLYIIDDFLTTHNTFGAILGVAEPSLDPNFRAIFIRKSLNDLKTAGSVVDTFKDAYGNIINVKVSENPRMTFPSGAYVEARQVQNEDPKKIIEEWKGVQADLISWEELTSYEWFTFMYIMSRCRGRGQWSGKIRATLNPKKRHWVRKWLDWYINPITGYPIPERDGVVRYFYLNGETVDDLVWGSSKKEVYYKCKSVIDEKLAKLGSSVKYEDMIKSFTFYKGSISENKALLQNNAGYVGSVAATGGKTAKILIDGNWNVDEEDDAERPLPFHTADAVFDNDPRINNDFWITADLADTGDDNTVILVWNGLHIIDYKIICTSTPRLNAEYLRIMAEKYDIPNRRIIYDGTRAAYINDYLPGSQAFMSSYRPCGKYGRQYVNLKDECYARLVEVIRRENLSFEPSIAQAKYEHKKMTSPITIREEFTEECSVVDFKDTGTGKKTLLNKKEMNQMLGKGRSMDLLDPIAMRMYPLLRYEYGSELAESTPSKRERENSLALTSGSIYDDSTWY